MIGSETFIIVALRWIENSTSCCLAAASCCSRKETNAFLLSTVASKISPGSSAVFSLSTVVLPSLETNSIFTVVAAGKVTDFSFE